MKLLSERENLNAAENPNFVDPRPWAHGLRELVLFKLSQMGGTATAREVADATGKRLDWITPRFTELAYLGRVKGTRKASCGQRGRPAVVWQLT